MERKSEELLQEVMAKRGFVLDFHKVMVKEDPEFMKCYEALINHVSTQKRTLDRKIKAFIYIGVLTALQADPSHIGKHIKRAIENGATKQEVLEVLELIYPPCGTLRFANGIKAFEDFFGGQ